MREFKCLINKTYKKICYPIPIVIEPLYTENFKPLVLICDEIKSGDIMICEFINQKVESIFLTKNKNLHQIYGKPIDYNHDLVLKCAGIKKKFEIEKYIETVLFQLRLNELINNKNDLIDFENEIMKYLLACKSKDKVEQRKLRKLIFKTCKNVKLAEKICQIVKNTSFNHFEASYSTIQVYFSTLTVQSEYAR